MDIFWNCTLQGSRGGERVEIERHASPAPTTPPPSKVSFLFLHDESESEVVFNGLIIFLHTFLLATAGSD